MRTLAMLETPGSWSLTSRREKTDQDRHRVGEPRMPQRFRLSLLADVSVMAAFVVLVILGYVALIKFAGEAIFSAAQNLLLPGQYP
jgi:hypothetical protein